MKLLVAFASAVIGYFWSYSLVAGGHNIYIAIYIAVVWGFISGIWWSMWLTDRYNR